MSDDRGQRSRVFFDGGTPEEYLVFKRAAQADLIDAASGEEEKTLKRMLGNKPKGEVYANRTRNFGSLDSLWEELDAAFGGKTTERATQELIGLRQGGKSIGDFIQEFADLAAQAGIRDPMRAVMFKAQVNDGIKQYILADPSQRFIELAEKARTMGPLAERQFKRAKGGPSGKQGPKERVNAVRAEKGKFTGLCYNCQTVCGNSAKTCTRPKKEREGQKGRKAQTGAETTPGKVTEDSDFEEAEN
jgi:hypothetical protein